MNALALDLAMSARTLQRRLAAEGISYQEVREAYLVGYSEPAPFHRAFKRWYGMTPNEFRHELRTGRSRPSFQTTDGGAP
jgi:AraC-like DNA-binding protein